MKMGHKKKGYGTTLVPGTLLLINAAATSALGFPTSAFLIKLERDSPGRIPEEELSVEIGVINGIHVDNVNISKSGVGKVF
jgi:hypothetical protein